MMIETFHSHNNIWDDSSKARHEYTMSGSDFQHQISEFINLDKSLDRDGINIATNQLENIILNTTNGCLRKPKSKTKKKGLSNKKWFDCDLDSQKAQLIKMANLMSHNPFDNNIKNRFYKLRRLYNKNRKFQMKNFKENILKQLDELHNDNPKGH